MFFVFSQIESEKEKHEEHNSGERKRKNISREAAFPNKTLHNSPSKKQDNQAPKSLKGERKKGWMQQVNELISSTVKQEITPNVDFQLYSYLNTPDREARIKQLARCLLVLNEGVLEKSLREAHEEEARAYNANKSSRSVSGYNSEMKKVLTQKMRQIFETKIQREEKGNK